MMNWKKGLRKGVAALLCCSLAFSAVPLLALAEDGAGAGVSAGIQARSGQATVDGIEYTLNDDETATVTGGETTDGELMIPATIEHEDKPIRLRRLQIMPSPHWELKGKKYI